MCEHPVFDVISIHALLAEGDMLADIDREVVGISIHALLAEGDANTFCK